MSSNRGFLEPSGLRVTVDRVCYHPDAKTPPDRPYCFVYFISIHNDTETIITLKGRKWIVTNPNGEVMVVEADGIVGEFPCLAPGEKFSYNSFHLLDTRKARAEGSYVGLDELGRKVLTRIPPFEMEAPED